MSDTAVVLLTEEIKKLTNTIRRSNSSSMGGSSSSSGSSGESAADAMNKFITEFKEYTKQTKKTSNVMMKFGEASETSRLQMARLTAKYTDQARGASNVTQRLNIMRDAVDSVSTATGSHAAKTAALQTQISKATEEMSGLAKTTKQQFLAGELIQKTVDGLSRAEGVTEEFVNAFKSSSSTLNESSAFLSTLSSSISTLDQATGQYADVLVKDGTVQNQTRQALEALMASGIDTTEALDELNKGVIDQAKLTKAVNDVQEKAAASHKHGAKAIADSSDQVVKSFTGLNAITGTVSNKFNELTGRLTDNVTAMTVLSNTAMVVKRDLDEMRGSQTSFWTSMLSPLAGVAAETAAAMSKSNRQAFNAIDQAASTSNGAMSTWTSTMVKSRFEVLKYTRNSEAATAAIADTISQMASVGVKMSSFGDVGREAESAAREMAVLSKLTGEENGQLNGRINAHLQDSSIRGELLGLHERERKAYVKGLRSRLTEGVARGKTIEQMFELEKSMRRFNREIDPKDQLKQIYKTTALLTALGMDAAEASELQQLALAGKLESDPRGRELAAKAETIKETARSSGDITQRSIAFKLQQEGGDFVAILTTLSNELDKGKDVQWSLDSLKQSIDNAGVAISAHVTGVWDTATSFLTSSLFGVAAGAYAVIKVFKNLPKIIGLIKQLPKVLSFVKGFLQKGSLKAGAMSAGIGMVKAAGKVMALPAPGGLASDVAKKAAGPTAAAATSKATAKIVEKAGLKSLGSAGVKSLIKKIPGLGLIAGLGFGIGRLMDGDFVGAGGEVLSGAASIVPGVGTAASVGIDAALIARDLAAANAKESKITKPIEKDIEQADSTKKLSIGFDNTGVKLDMVNTNLTKLIAIMTSEQQANTSFREIVVGTSLSQARDIKNQTTRSAFNWVSPATP